MAVPRESAQAGRADVGAHGRSRATARRSSPATGVARRRAESQALAERETERLLKRYAKTRDAASRDQLAERFMPLAHRLARRYIRSSEPNEDLKQVACLGLLKALDRFDPDRGHNFASFAIPTILGELRRYFRDSTWAVHVPRSAQERAQSIEAAEQELSGATGNAPSVQEIGEHLDISSAEVLEGLLAVRAYQADSLDTPSGTDGEGRTMLEELGAEDPAYELVEADLTVAPALRRLEDRERRILQMRYIGEMSQSEIARAVGVSQMQVSRIIARTLDRLAEMSGVAPVV